VTEPLDSLRNLIAAEPALHAELAACGEPRAFVETALAIARRHGIALGPEDLAPLAARDPLGMVQLEAPRLRRAGWPPPGWLPYRLAREADGSLAVDWADFGGVALDGRFFAEAVHEALARPFNRLLRCRTGLEDFLRGPPEGLRAPDGFVFHMSRCGSSLVARMLAALPGAFVIAEAEPLDAMLRIVAGPAVPDDLRGAALRAMVGALGRRSSGRWFVKLAAWPALALPLFRRVFPDVPWLFLHRDPAEVIASQMATRAPELAPAFTPSSLYGIENGAALPDEVYCAMALARVCEAALAADGGLFVDHEALPNAFLAAILPHFGIDADQAPRRKMLEIAGRHAKHPDLPYRPDAAVIAHAVRAAADAHLAGTHARLKAVHGAQSLL
jgi:hypothetical protein